VSSVECPKPYAAIFVLVAAAIAAPAAGQTWPAKTVRIVVPYTPAGGVDTVARLMGQRLSEQTGATFVVENRPGAGGVIGAELVARAAPDGYTLLMSASEFGINPAVRAKLPYDPFRDFAFISQIALVQFILAGHPSVPVKTVKELIAFAKARPGQLTFGSAGAGSGPHFSGEMFQAATGIRWLHVPFKGAAPAATAVVSGEVGFLFSSTITLMPHVRGGRLRAIAVTGTRRYSELPELPTFAESGLPGYEPPLFYGYYAPAGTSPELARRIHAEAARALNAPDVKEKLSRTGNDYIVTTPEEFEKYLRTQIPIWTKIARQAGIRVD
jgi:tripartite-type tricarboxylate transporter receptor subunit TctC